MRAKLARESFNKVLFEVKARLAFEILLFQKALKIMLFLSFNQVFVASDDFALSLVARL